MHIVLIIIWQSIQMQVFPRGLRVYTYPRLFIIIIKKKEAIILVQPLFKNKLANYA
jgi:hypothetical protein